MAMSTLHPATATASARQWLQESEQRVPTIEAHTHTSGSLAPNGRLVRAGAGGISASTQYEFIAFGAFLRLAGAKIGCDSRRVGLPFMITQRSAAIPYLRAESSQLQNLRHYWRLDC